MNHTRAFKLAEVRIRVLHGLASREIIAANSDPRLEPGELWAEASPEYEERLEEMESRIARYLENYRRLETYDFSRTHVKDADFMESVDRAIILYAMGARGAENVKSLADTYLKLYKRTEVKPPPVMPPPSPGTYGVQVQPSLRRKLSKSLEVGKHPLAARGKAIERRSDASFTREWREGYCLSPWLEPIPCVGPGIRRGEKIYARLCPANRGPMAGRTDGEQYVMVYVEAEQPGGGHYYLRMRDARELLEVYPDELEQALIDRKWELSFEVVKSGGTGLIKGDFTGDIAA